MDLALAVAIRQQFSRGLKYEEIISFLNHRFGYSMSLRQLHRVLRRYGLYRKGNSSEFRDEIMFITNLITHTSASSLGYRQVNQECIRNGYVVTRNNVCTILKEIDPEGVEKRKKHRLQRRKYYSLGPNWAWHIDGYDKLKPYKFVLYKSCTGWWMSFFKDMIEEGILDTSNEDHHECVQFVFAKIIQKDLNDFKERSNSHSIRPNLYSDRKVRPSGRPDVLYFTPNMSSPEVVDYKLNYNELDFAVAVEECCENENHEYICSEHFNEIALFIMEQENLNHARNATEGRELFISLLENL